MERDPLSLGGKVLEWHPHELAGLLKMWLLELLEPIITDDY